MTYTTFIPGPPLNAYVDDFYYMDGPAPYPRQKALPVASSNLMINLGDLFVGYRANQAEPFITCKESWWVGVWNIYHSVAWPQNVQFYGVHFKPGGAYPFLQFPLSEISGQVVPLDAIWGPYAAEIRERLSSAPTVQAGFAVLECLLLARLCDAPRSEGLVRFAISEIARNHGALSIRGLSEHLDISQNYLSTQFKRLVGTPPKEVARLYRFARALRLIDSGLFDDLTCIAHQSHFYDQSHFNREFAVFTGHSPSQYVLLRRRVETENPEHARAYRNLPVD